MLSPRSCAKFGVMLSIVSPFEFYSSEEETFLTSCRDTVYQFASAPLFYGSAFKIGTYLRKVRTSS